MFDKAIFKLPHIHRTLAILVLFAMMETACILGEAFGLSRGLVALWEGGVFEDALWNLSLFACSFVCVRITLDLREAFISSYALRCARGTRKALSDGRTASAALRHRNERCHGARRHR